ncbi:MBL fold metallo-hydrolase [Alicyclobacillus mali]|uniref:MBL fold metallo-hydrolase n=1 Tax=Alicyclobacillus mali (ex Roth et al. 2021) TaxID=1123961 RepID=A0ABS0F4N7_9BACL|nr:MBL fold metallo-hydrolase [Alicyclobacillus mali (ex Roth et al. 2021)]MBF8378196.1 MBL fold metallo-hydrolase [Alicyclobacillus mali (ex Roth et al. 2021)]
MSVDKSTRITFFGGTRTIGGTICRVKTASAQIVFDMGHVVRPASPMFSGSLRPRSTADLRAVGILPDIPELYQIERQEHLSICISHNHLDHTALLPYMANEISVFSTKETCKILKLISEAKIEDQPPLRVTGVEVETWQRVGDLQFQFVPVDHDTPGAAAIFITAPDLRLVYSGDLRFHGWRPEISRAFVEKARLFEPDVLLVEGTRAGDEARPQVTEQELVQLIVDEISSEARMVYFNAYPRHPERVLAFARAAQAAGRTPVFEARTLYVASQFASELPEGVRVWADDDLPDPVRQWVEAAHLPLVRAVDVRTAPNGFAAELAYDKLWRLIDLGPAANGLYIHSNGAPLGPFDPAWDNLQRWLAHFGVSFRSIGTSGHAALGEIEQAVADIRPRVYLPIHSFHPERVVAHGIPRVLPDERVDYTLPDLLAAASVATRA